MTKTHFILFKFSTQLAQNASFISSTRQNKRGMFKKQQYQVKCASADPRSHHPRSSHNTPECHHRPSPAEKSSHWQSDNYYSPLMLFREYSFQTILIIYGRVVRPQKATRLKFLLSCFISGQGRAFMKLLSHINNQIEKLYVLLDF